ncbi:hypothetical protein FT663_01545 [Candidozyma haemuli var. vulneris]|nr:hypothetical protein FT662_02123 [[Candida] haemuloni var. vulneris]KAF3994314.1 hypothetical protein FT663_01545 [[Candida] haemuloni var. vulneris]
MSEPTETKVPGLSTPALTNGEFTDASAEMPPKVDDAETHNTSLLEIANELDGNIQQILDLMEKNDKDVYQQLDDISERIERMKRRCATSPEEPKK